MTAVVSITVVIEAKENPRIIVDAGCFWGDMILFLLEITPCYS